MEGLGVAGSRSAYIGLETRGSTVDQQLSIGWILFAQMNGAERLFPVGEDQRAP
jgi:hypothetical protein